MSKETIANSIHRLTRSWPQLTTLILTGAALLTLTVWPTANPFTGGNAAAFISIKVTFFIGKTASCNAGFGICKIVVGATGKQLVNATLTPQGSDRMEAIFESAPPNAERLLELHENLILDEASARKLGFKSVTILKGSYAYDSAKGRFGGVVFNVRTTK
ncbi:MAG: hypothetical protein ACKVZH_12790 [Blastocatellia bacterium]